MEIEKKKRPHQDDTVNEIPNKVRKKKKKSTHSADETQKQREDVNKHTKLVQGNTSGVDTDTKKSTDVISKGLTTDHEKKKKKKKKDKSSDYTPEINSNDNPNSSPEHGITSDPSVKAEAGNHDNKGPEWTFESTQKLIHFFLTLPMHSADNLSQSTYIRNISWEQIGIPGYNTEQCKLRWKQLYTKAIRLMTIADINPLMNQVLEMLQKDINAETGMTKGSHPHMAGYGKNLKIRRVTPKTLYVKDKVDQELSENPKINLKERKEHYSKQWTMLKSKRKVKWIEMAYKIEEETKNHNQMHTQVFISKAEKKIKNKADGMPDLPPGSAYSLFTQRTLPTLKNQDLGQQRFKVIGNMWQELSTEEKQKYHEELTKIQEKYEEQLKQYLQSLPEDQRKMFKKVEHTPVKKAANHKTPKVNPTSEVNKSSKLTLGSVSEASTVGKNKTHNSSSDSSDEETQKKTVKTKPTSVVKSKKVDKKASESSSSSDEETKQMKTKLKMTALFKGKKTESSSSSSGSESSDDDPPKPVMKSPSKINKKKADTSDSSSEDDTIQPVKKSPSKVQRKSPSKVQRKSPSKVQKSESDSSDSSDEDVKQSEQKSSPTKSSLHKAQTSPKHTSGKVAVPQFTSPTGLLGKPKIFPVATPVRKDNSSSSSSDSDSSE